MTDSSEDHDFMKTARKIKWFTSRLVIATALALPASRELAIAARADDSNA